MGNGFLVLVSVVSALDEQKPICTRCRAGLWIKLVASPNWARAKYLDEEECVLLDYWGVLSVLHYTFSDNWQLI